MAQAPAAIFKIPTKSPQPPRGRASRALRAAAARPKAASRVAGIETRAATGGDGEVIELDLGITVYPPRDKGGRWRAVMYIEVKSTKAADPNAQFWISRAEVELARGKRGRYYIYRVTETDTEAPTIRRVSDPLGLVLEGKGRVMLSQARVELSFDSPKDSPADDLLADENQSY